MAGLMPHAVAFAPDGRTVYMTDAGPGALVVLDRTGGAASLDYGDNRWFGHRHG
jgi:DNA-binding beta-propeller fold protein YncE